MIYNQLEFKPKEDEIYYYIDFNNNEVSYAFYKTTIPQLYSPEYVLTGINYTTNNCFKTKELAEEYLELHNEIERMKKEYPVDWSDRYNGKYLIGCDYTSDDLVYVAYSLVQLQGSFYVSNEEVLQQFIKEYKSSIKKFLFGIEEEELYFIRFPMFEYENDLNYLNFNLEQECWYIEDNEELIDFNKTHFTKQECDKIIADNNLQNVVELEKVE